MIHKIKGRFEYHPISGVIKNYLNYVLAKNVGLYNIKTIKDILLNKN